MSSYTSSAQAIVSAEPFYGYPVIYENEQYHPYNYNECFPLPLQTTSAEFAEIIPSATVTFGSTSNFPLSQEVETVPLPVAYDSESEFFDGIIEILEAESDIEKQRGNSFFMAASSLSPVALPVASEAFEENLIFSDDELTMMYPTAAISYAVPEAKQVFYESEEEKKDFYDYDAFTVDCVTAFEGMDVSGSEMTFPSANTIVSAEECKPASGELFEVGTIDVDYLRSLYGADDKKARRKESIDRWRAKKNKRKASSQVKKVVTSSVNSFSEAAAAACNSLLNPLNPRQKATAKRQRENGKFRKAQVNWVSVTDLFSNCNSAYEDFK
jgi:hypothetical protein